MKATDLMLGDWVLMDMNFSEENPIYTQPDYRHYQIKNGEDINLACETNCLGDADVYLPIPLTPEILEKNGFEEYDGAYIYYTAHYDVCIEWCGTILKIGCDNGNIELADIQYVHELQHALKLCDVEKEIVL